jgi:anti-sigma regulatory factor (Ser/Thr protein kinase)
MPIRQSGGLMRWEGAYPAEDSSAARARLEVVGALSRAGVRGEAREHAEMVAAELVNNAIIHAATGFTVEVEADGDRVRIGVRDGSSRTPLMVERRPDEWPGMGLHIVAGLASAWGWQLSLAARGKVVWAEVEGR